MCAFKLTETVLLVHNVLQFLSDPVHQERDVGAWRNEGSATHTHTLSLSLTSTHLHSSRCVHRMTVRMSVDALEPQTTELSAAPSMYMYMRDAEGRKNKASKVKQG